MLNVDSIYRELHGLVWQGRRQGFVAGLIFSGGVMAANRAHKSWRIKMDKRNTNDVNPN